MPRAYGNEQQINLPKVAVRTGGYLGCILSHGSEEKK